MSRLLLVGAVLLAASVVAHADVPPLPTLPCQNKAAGTDCTVWLDAGPGICVESTCMKKDLTNWDGSANPPTVPYACLICVADADASVPSGSGGASDAGASGAGGAPGAGGAVGTGGAGGTGGSDDPGNCAVGHGATSRVAPWILGAAFSLLFLFGRRRARR